MLTWQLTVNIYYVWCCVIAVNYRSLPGNLRQHLTNVCLRKLASRGSLLQIAHGRRIEAALVSFRTLCNVAYSAGFLNRQLFAWLRAKRRFVYRLLRCQSGPNKWGLNGKRSKNKISQRGVVRTFYSIILGFKKPWIIYVLEHNQ